MKFRNTPSDDLSGAPSLLATLDAWAVLTALEHFASYNPATIRAIGGREFETRIRVAELDLMIHDVALHQKSGSVWAQLPSKRWIADPFEGPRYGKGKARIYRRENASLLINSFAHGGIQYELKSAPKPEDEAEIDRLARLTPLDYERAQRRRSQKARRPRHRARPHHRNQAHRPIAKKAVTT